MTDKEKANRHIKNNYVIFEDIMQVEYQLDSLREKDYLAGLEEGRKEICKKILEEVKKMWQEDSDYFSDLEGIIKNLGIEV